MVSWMNNVGDESESGNDWENGMLYAYRGSTSEVSNYQLTLSYCLGKIIELRSLESL